MLNRILLSLLSIGLVAGTVQGAQDNFGNRSYFYFDKGATGDEILYGRYRPLFWPSQSFGTTADISEQVAFVQSLKEISRHSRVAAKDGFFYGLGIGSICGALAGGLIGTIIGCFSKTSNDHAFADKSKQQKINMLLKGLKGILWGSITGGVTGAGLYTTVAVDESTRLFSPTACGEHWLKKYCTLAHSHAYNQLINFSPITPELAAILSKARDGKALSEVEKEELNTSSILFSPIDSTYYVREASLAEVVETFNKTDVSQRARVATIVKGGNRAQEYAKNNKMTALMAASKDDIALASLYSDLQVEDHFNRVQ
jgi:hypothetical protein